MNNWTYQAKALGVCKEYVLRTQQPQQRNLNTLRQSRSSNEATQTQPRITLAMGAARVTTQVERLVQ
ncbi:hypothetical protein F0262_22985 [Vibrio rotiferianus]|uniref:Uncharacterized protein n=1 Tax=Vibrio rotiferianus TaxID=190895 RepID=A0A7Y4E447_9VIBR|nr:hypothetical protein [Vibrio rotiferianus]NOH50892.1 hypothetical protein [Vibrio rotiferianus]